MHTDRKLSILKWNLAFFLLFLAFMAGVYFDVRIEMGSLAVTSFGLIFFPILFVVVNMRILNQRYPLSSNDDPDKPV